MSYRPSPPTGGVALAMALVALLLLPLPTRAETPRNSYVWWVDKYGALEDDYPAAQRAHEIFERLRTTLDDRLDVELVLLATTEPLSPRALPDDSIVLARSILDLCYEIRGPEGKLPKKEKKLERGDVRLAHFLGHELQHVVKGDTELRAFTDHRAVFDTAESLADFQGMMTLWYAGYDPDLLFQKDRRFFHEWAEWIESPEDSGQREELLRERLERARSYVPYFHWGTRLLQLGRYQDGLELLERFRTEFDSREVASNLGYAYYQLAAERLADCEGKLVVRFQLPVRVDPETLADRSRRRGGTKSSECFENRSYRQAMDDAQRLLEQGTERDPEYLPARLNYVAALLLDEEPAAAVNVAREAVQLAPDSPEAQNGSALALYLFGTQSNLSDAAEQALERLSAAYEKHPEATYLLYNLARMNDERKRTAQARELWLEYLSKEPRGPWADVARERLGQKVRDIAPSKPSTLKEPLVPLGDAGKRLRGFDRHEIERASFDGVFHESAGVSALEIEGVIEVVENRLDPLEPPVLLEDLLRLHGEADRRLAIHGGEIVFYPGYALDVRDGRVVAEIWFEPSKI